MTIVSTASTSGCEPESTGSNPVSHPFWPLSRLARGEPAKLVFGGFDSLSGLFKRVWYNGYHVSLPS